jgi:glycosyltransferase involved in cell wall biosynthesis
MDGVPNVLYEAMACGAVPIVSPLPSITPVVQDGANVLFARNLHVQEITDAIVRAMTDDALADAIAHRNLQHVRQLADRARIGEAVAERYKEIARAQATARQAASPSTRIAGTGKAIAQLAEVSVSDAEGRL